MARMYPDPRLLVDPYDPDQLAGLFSKIKKAVDKAIPKELKKVSVGYQVHKKVVEPFVGKYAKYIAPIAALIPGFGWAIALGVKATGAAYEEAKAAASVLKQNAANTAELWTQYQELAGTVPGRAMGLALASDIFKAAIGAGKFPQFSPKWKVNDAVRNAIESCPKNCGAGLRDVVRQALSEGVNQPAEILERYWLPSIDSTWKPPWGLPTDALGSQVWVDLIDALIAEADPNAPLYYGMREGQTDAAVIPAPQSQKVPTVPVPADAVPGSMVPPAIAVPTLPPNATTADVAAAIQQMTHQLIQSQQGQAMTPQQQANAAAATALQWLQSQGINADPAAVASTVDRTVTTAGASNAPLWLLGAGLVFALAMPGRRSKRSTRKRSRG